jgi:hypothetical protein
MELRIHLPLLRARHFEQLPRAPRIVYALKSLLLGRESSQSTCVEEISIAHAIGNEASLAVNRIVNDHSGHTPWPQMSAAARPLQRPCKRSTAWDDNLQRQRIQVMSKSIYMICGDVIGFIHRFFRPSLAASDCTC